MSLTTVDGRYQVTARIASGGMGEVYRARDTVLARDVAIKVLHANLAGDAGFIDRFRREARSAALLSHPNIVAVHDWGSTDGTYFMVMEYVRGRNLRDLLTTYGRLEPQQAVDVLLQMLAALEHAHRRGIVHRDVKPENVLVTADGTVKVADFGLARAFSESRITQAPGTVTGTVQYLAPEQIQGDPADPRTDLYATGVVAYELLTGKVPFTGETSLAIAYKHLSDRVPPPSKIAPDVPPSLDEVVRVATEKRRDERPRSAQDLGHLVAETSAEVAPAAPLAELVRKLPAPDEVTPEERARTVTIPKMLAPKQKRQRRRRRLAALFAVLAVLFTAGWASWTYLVPHYAVVPSVLGLDVGEGRARLEDVGMDVEIGTPVTSTEFPDGTVAQQSVPGGEEARTGTVVILRPSTGLPLRTVPTLKGKTEGQAKAALEEVDLVLGDVTEEYSERVGEGKVIDQNPSAETAIQFGSEVSVVISLGPQPVEVPSVIGLSQDEAIAVLRSNQLQAEVVEQYSDSVERGNVIRQQPGSGTEVPKDTTVTIFVSLGPEEFEMPNVIGMDGAAAENELESLGLDVQVIQLPGQSGNDVVFQDPGPGTIVRRGDDVKIYLA
jgi:serine/threonine-protein kinase